MQRSNACKNPKIKIRMRQPYFFQKKDGIGPLQKTISAFCHNSKQTKNDQETYGCIYYKLSFMNKCDPVEHIHRKLVILLPPFTHFLHNIL